MSTTANNPRVALITGAAKRVGATTAKRLHGLGWNIVVHYGTAYDAALALAAELNAIRANSAVVTQANLTDPQAVQQLADDSLAAWGQLDALINNASSFYPTPLGSASQAQWDDLFASNVRAPFFLSQALAPHLGAHRRGRIVNIADIHARYPLAEHSIYSMAKAALEAMTRSLAKELAPHITVNAVAPGAIAWPEGPGEMSESLQQDILRSIPLQRMGGEQAIAEAVCYFVEQADYITGQVLAVDGGRSLWG